MAEPKSSVGIPSETRMMAGGIACASIGGTVKASPSSRIAAPRSV